MVQMIQAPPPNASESQENYTIRAHQQLLSSVPDPDERNTMVWSAWAHFNGETNAEKAASKEFGDTTRFTKVPNYCYFVTHDTVDSNGNDVTFGVGDLAEITQTCNKRASDQRHFAAICDNHTSPTDQSAAGDPEVLGAVGSYRLGMSGHEEPKFSIFADEYQYTEKAEKLAGKPRRSIELITFHNTGERFIDPVAALGGRAPRLPMPSRFSVQQYSALGVAEVSRYQIESHDEARADRREQAYRDTHVRRPKQAEAPPKFEPKGINIKDSAGAAHVDKYDMEGPAMLPGGGNTHIKSTDYFADEDQPEHEETSMQSISDEDIAKIINAVGNMPQFSWVDRQMEAENGGAVDQAAPGGMDDVGAEPGMDEGMDQMGGDPMGGDPMGGEGMDADFGDPEGLDGLDQNAMYGESSGADVVTGPAEDAEFDDQQQFMADAAPSDTQFPEEAMNYSANPGAGVSVERFQAVQAELAAVKTSHIGLMKQYGEFAKKAQSAERAQIDAGRKQDIQEICSRYSMFDANEECGRLLFEAGADLSDEQFHGEIQRMLTIGSRTEQYAVENARIPTGASTVHRPAVNGNGSVERNGAWYAKSTQIQTAAANNNEFLDWDQLCQATDKALTAAPQA